MAEAPAGEPTDPQSGGRLANALYLVGFVGFLGTAVAFLVLVALGSDPQPALLGNAIAAGLLVVWAASDTLGDPDSEVTSVPGAVGTGMLLLGVYGILAGIVVAATSPWHDRFAFVWLFAGGGAIAGVLGFATFPLEVVMSDTPTADDEGGPETE
jgi:hypothetical protein